MKRLLKYSKMREMLLEKIPVLQERNYDAIMAVLRGGMTASHIIAKELRLKCGAIMVYEDDIEVMLPRGAKKVLVVEDLVGEGRTYRLLKEKMPENIDWDFMPIIVDGDYDGDFELSLMKTKDWIVFPYEEYDKVSEGDRGLFRAGTDVYGVK